MDSRLKFTLNDHNQLLSRFPHRNSGGTFKTTFPGVLRAPAHTSAPGSAFGRHCAL